MNKNEQQIKVMYSSKKERVAVEQNSMELSCIFNTTKEEQKKGVARRDLGNGNYIKISNIGGELLRNEDLTTFLACFLLYKHSRRKKGYSFETSYNQFFRLI